MKTYKKPFISAVPFDGSDVLALSGEQQPGENYGSQGIDAGDFIL